MSGEFETLTNLCLDLVHMRIGPADAYEQILKKKKSHDELSSELIDVLVLTEQESEFAENAATSRAHFEAFVHLVANTIIPEDILRLELDCFKVGKEEHNRALIRLKTKVYFKQAKYNLFREESEGYAKLITELIEAAECSAPLEYAKTVKQRILSLIGQFNLDPNRVTDVILEIFEHCPRQKLFFITLLKEIDVVRDYLCAILGFKFTFYQSDKKKTPYSLYVLASSLIQHEMIDMMKILAFMVPKADSIKEGHRARMTNAQARSSQAETISTAAMPILEDNGHSMTFQSSQPISFTTVIQLQEDEDVKLSDGFNEESVLGCNQKLGLACALLESGNWRMAQMLIDRLPEYYAVQASPRLCRALCKIIERAINDFYKENCSLNLFGDVLKSNKPVLNDMGNGLKPIESWDDLGKLSTTLWYLGPRIAFRASTNVKLLRLLTTYYRKVEKEELPRDEKLNQIFVEVVSECLLPSLTLSDANVALSEELWQLLQMFPYSWRYWMYSKWNQETGRHPEMNIMRGKIHGRTKYVLKRLSKETVKMMGRQLGKLCHVHPATVLSYLLSQVQTFDNFIGPVVDSLRYLTSLEFDVLTYCIISQLADPSKQALKSTDATLSPWLQALGTLVGSLYRRYSLELNGMLDYVLNQLKLCKSYDLLLLREIIQNMSWIESISGATKEQIDALGGGDLLKQEAGGYSTATKNRKAAQRLRDALLKGDLAIGLCITIAQQKNNIIFNESANLPMKLIGEMVDQCSDTLQQLVSFLSVYLKNDEFVKRAPSVKELLSEYSLGMDETMCLARPAFFAKISESYEAAKKASKSEEGGPKARLDTQQKTDLFGTAMDERVAALVEELKEFIPQDKQLPTKYFAVFWMLSMYDIEVPTAAYEKTLEGLRKQTREDNHGKSKRGDRNLESKLRDEQKRQTEHVERVKTWLANNKDSLMEETPNIRGLEVFIQQCALPRALFSELDAVFCGQFFFLIHEMKTPYFPTILIIDRLFENVVTLFAGLTENEANSLSRFLEMLLTNAMRWHADKEVFEKECAGFPGMVTKCPMDYQTFRKLCYRWQIRLGKTFVAVLGKEDAHYVLIRNTLILMTKLTPSFPLLSTTITQMESAAVKLRDREKGKRDDLSLMGASYIGRLKLRNVKIYTTTADFAPIVKSKKKEEKVDGEPVDKKAKVEKNGEKKEENGVEKTDKVEKIEKVEKAEKVEKVEETKERKKRAVKSTLYVAPKGAAESKKSEQTEEGEVVTPSPPPPKKTRITDRLRRPEEQVEKKEKESPDSEKSDGSKKRSKERSKEKEALKEKKEKKRENTEPKKEPKRREVAGPTMPDPSPKREEKKASRKAIEFDLEDPKSARKERKEERKEKKEEMPRASRISDPTRGSSRASSRDRDHRGRGDRAFR